MVGTKQFASKMNSLGCQLSTEKCPEEKIQEYLQVAIFSPVAVKFDKAPAKEISTVLKFFSPRTGSKRGHFIILENQP